MDSKVAPVPGRYVRACRDLGHGGEQDENYTLLTNRVQSPISRSVGRSRTKGRLKGVNQRDQFC